jgi:hypothetical protein
MNRKQAILSSIMTWAVLALAPHALTPQNSVPVDIYRISDFHPCCSSSSYNIDCCRHPDTGEPASSRVGAGAPSCYSGSMERRIRQTAQRPGKAATAVRT